jgi:hypothetical protein
MVVEVVPVRTERRGATRKPCSDGSYPRRGWLDIT